MSTHNIPLGTMDSTLYIKDGEQHYKISPILGQRINFSLNSPVRKIIVVSCSTKQIVLKPNLWLTIKMTFKPNVRNLEKVRITPYYFGILPMGIYFGDICSSNKGLLIDAFKQS